MINKDNIKIGDKVYKIITYGRYPNVDMQVVAYMVKYIGKDAFIPEDFQTLKEEYQIINYSDCYSTLAEVEIAVIEKYREMRNEEIKDEINEIKLVPLYSDPNRNSCWNVKHS